MKLWSFLLFALFLVNAGAQSINAPTTNSLSQVNTDEWLLSDKIRHPEQTPLLILQQKPNELRLGKITLSGIAVATAKADNPLQLINPWAPPEYGESQDNAVFSLITNRVTGWKLFAFEF